MKAEKQTSASCVRVSQDGTHASCSHASAAEPTRVHRPGVKRLCAGESVGAFLTMAVRGLRTKLYSLCLLLVAVATIGNTGCTVVEGVNEYFAYNDRCDEFVLGWRNYVWSNQAWLARRHLYAGHPQFYALGEGFCAGYQDVASGGNGCPPALPPREFWSWQYQTGEGQAKVAAWFEGFPIGAEAAKEDGAGESQQIQIAGTIGGQYSAGFQSGQCPNCNVIHLGTPQASTPEQVNGQPVEITPAPSNESAPQLAPAQDSDLGFNGHPAARNGRIASTSNAAGVRRTGSWFRATQDTKAVRNVAYVNDKPVDAWPQMTR